MMVGEMNDSIGSNKIPWNYFARQEVKYMIPYLNSRPHEK